MVVPGGDSLRPGTAPPLHESGTVSAIGRGGEPRRLTFVDLLAVRDCAQAESDEFATWMIGAEEDRLASDEHFRQQVADLERGGWWSL
jgi:hypothetical protein